MIADTLVESILAADCGTAFTRAALIDKVDGQFRLLAVGEALTGRDDLSKGLVEAVEDIELKTGRKLLRGHRLITPADLDGSGVDAAAIACSAGRAVRLISAAISPAQAASEAGAAVAGALADVVASICMQDIRAILPTGSTAEIKSAELQKAQADAILLLAGRENAGSPLLAELGNFIAKAGLVGEKGNKLPVIVAGSPASFETVDKVLGAVMDLQAVEPANGAPGCPMPQTATSALNDLYLKQSILSLPELGAFASDRWSAVVAAPKAVWTIAQFAAGQSGNGVLLVDLGGTVATIVPARGGRRDMEVSTNCGMGAGIYGVLAAAGSEEISRWLPFEAAPERVLEVGLTKALHPHSIAQLPEELMIEEAIAREAIKQAARQVSVESGLIIASGGFFSHLPHPGRLMLLLLDALQPNGAVSVAFDPLGVLPSLGALAAAFPQAAGEVLLRDALQPLGTAFSLRGSGKTGQLAAQVTVRYAEGGEFQADVAWGGLAVIPLAEGRKATLLVQLAAEAQFGDRPRGRRAEMEVSGGSLGIVVDARGRPLALPADPHERAGKLAEWRRALEV